MKNLLLFIWLSMVLYACQGKGNPAKSKGEKPADPGLPYVAESYADLEALYPPLDDTTLVVNFWATSCPPCIKEMPYFMQLKENLEAEPVRVILVSLDMARDLEKRVVPFIDKHRIDAEVILLADQNYSAWTEKIDSSWYGALPATLVTNGKHRKFHMGAFENYEDLALEVLPFLPD